MPSGEHGRGFSGGAWGKTREEGRGVDGSAAGKERQRRHGGGNRRGFTLVELLSVLAIGAVLVGAGFGVSATGWWQGGRPSTAWQEGKRLARWIGDAVREGIHSGRAFSIYPPAGTLENRIRLMWYDRAGNVLPGGRGDQWWTSNLSCYILSRRGLVNRSDFLPRQRMFVPGFTLEVRHRRRLADPPDCYVIVSPYAYIHVSATPPP